MNDHDGNANVRAAVPAWQRGLAVAAGLFGLLTIFSGGKVLFGPEEARIAAGAYVPFVVWFNFLAGFAYVAAAVLIWRGMRIACLAAALIAGATLLVFALFGLHIAAGGAFEGRTLGAMTLRSGFWLVATALLWRRRKGPAQ